jgi:hypothetical protein
MPVPGQYNEKAIDYTFKRDDLKIPDMKMYTPKTLGITSTKAANYYKAAPMDSYDPSVAFKAKINGISSSNHKKIVNSTILDKQYPRDDAMYTVDNVKNNISLENTKDLRAE